MQCNKTTLPTWLPKRARRRPLADACRVSARVARVRRHVIVGAEPVGIPPAVQGPRSGSRWVSCSGARDRMLPARDLIRSAPENEPGGSTKAVARSNRLVRATRLGRRLEARTLLPAALSRARGPIRFKVEMCHGDRG